MPKKKLGTHPKAVEARERKANQKVEEDARRQKEVEDEYWKDENKALKRKEERKVSAIKNTQYNTGQQYGTAL